MNLQDGIVDIESVDYHKIHVRGHFFEFSSLLVNEFLGRSVLASEDHTPPRRNIVRENIGGSHFD